MRQLVLVALAIASTSGYVFECLDKCECDTSDEVVHCHNGDRTELKLPESERLRGFHAIGLTYNNLEKLPSEDELLNKFPDLLAVDVERNPNFDCASIPEYTQVKIISDCYKNISDISQIPPLHRPNADCDVSCQAKKHYEELHKYVLKLWDIIKDKYRNFDKDQTLAQIKVWIGDQIKAFFIESIQNINRQIDKSLEEFHPRNQKQTLHAVTASPQLEMITEEPADIALD